MYRELRLSAWSLLAIGLAVGLSLGGAMTAGVLLGKRTAAVPAFPGLEELKLKAASSHGSDTFAIATGQVDEETEGLFTLDFITGDLKCFVLNRNGGVAGHFGINVNDKIFTAKRGKKPNYLLVTGSFAAGASSGGARPAACLCYVVDTNSGEVAAFGFPWNRAITSSGGVQTMPMALVQKWQARAVDLRQ